MSDSYSVATLDLFALASVIPERAVLACSTKWHEVKRYTGAGAGAGTGTGTGLPKKEKEEEIKRSESWKRNVSGMINKIVALCTRVEGIYWLKYLSARQRH